MTLVRFLLLALLAMPAAAFAQNFEPDGYYLPKEPLTVSDHQLALLDLRSMEYLYDRQNKGKLLRIPTTARVKIVNLGDKSETRHRCGKIVVKPETLSLVCPSTPMGVVTIKGHFIDARAGFRDRADVLPKQTVVVDATVSVTREGKELLVRRVAFTYWEGD